MVLLLSAVLLEHGRIYFIARPLGGHEGVRIPHHETNCASLIQNHANGTESRDTITLAVVQCHGIERGKKAMLILIDVYVLISYYNRWVSFNVEVPEFILRNSSPSHRRLQVCALPSTFVAGFPVRVGFPDLHIIISIPTD